MPRKPHIHYCHAFYHVMLRGNYHQNIFRDDRDRNIFYDILNNSTNRFSCQIYLFCLMSNHVHLVMEVKEISLSKIMHSIAYAYARQYNKKYKLMGNLFHRRYKAKLIQNDAYLLELCHYIHNNPLKANICQSLD